MYFDVCVYMVVCVYLYMCAYVYSIMCAHVEAKD